MNAVLVTTFALALREIRRHLMRSFLTVLGIVIGVGSVVTMVTLGNGTTAAVQQQIQLRRFLNYNWEYGVERVQESITEHLEILDALDAGHNERASALMRNHLTTSAHHGVMNPDHAKPR